MKKAILLFILIAAAAAIAFGLACSKSTEPDDTPTVPGPETVTMDFTTFTQVSRARPAERCEHFDTAATIVVVWSSITQAVFALPRLAFVLAVSQTPTYEGSETWSWGYGVDTSNVRLTGRILPSDSVEWKLYVTNSELSDFLWYEGHCDFEATGGWWKFYSPDLTPPDNEVLLTVWEKNEADTTAHLLLSNIETGTDEYGDTLEYDLDGSIASCRIHDISGSREGEWNMTWHISQNYGRIVYPEATTACWDESRQCIDCDSLSLP